MGFKSLEFESRHSDQKRLISKEIGRFSYVKSYRFLKGLCVRCYRADPWLILIHRMRSIGYFSLICASFLFTFKTDTLK